MSRDWKSVGHGLLAIVLVAAMAVAVAACAGTRSSSPEDNWINKAEPVTRSFTQIGALHAALMADTGSSPRAHAKQARAILAKIDAARQAAHALPPAPSDMAGARSDLGLLLEDAHKAYRDYIPGFTGDNQALLRRGDTEWTAAGSAAVRLSNELLTLNTAAGNTTAPKVANLVAFYGAVHGQQQQFNRANTLDSEMLSRFKAERNTARVRRMADRTVAAFSALLKAAQALPAGDPQTVALRNQYVGVLRLSLRAAQGYAQALRTRDVVGFRRAARLDVASAPAYGRFSQALQRYAHSLRSKS